MATAAAAGVPPPAAVPPFADWPSAFAAHIASAGLAAAWQFEERPGSWASMGDDLTLVLEQSWRQPADVPVDQGNVVCTESRRTLFVVNHLLGDAKYRYDLSPEGTGVQRNLSTRGPTRNLRRVETEPRVPAVNLGSVVMVAPPVPTPPNRHRGARVLEPGEEAHGYACAELCKSLNGLVAEEGLIQVEEIVNAEMAACFTAKLAAMGERANERWLWHGTNAESVKKIVANGFNRSFCGANGTVYGEGVYFASSASLSMK